jgi:hypothetical protein
LKTTIFADVAMALRMGFSLHPDTTLSSPVIDWFLSEPTTILVGGLLLIGLANLLQVFCSLEPTQLPNREQETDTA